MRDADGADWLGLARSHRIDPEDVRLVFSRYDAQRRFSAQGRGAPLSLDRWFEFYRLEKATEGRQAGPVPAGCSAEGDAPDDAVVERPTEFLQVLKAYAAAGAP